MAKKYAETKIRYNPYGRKLEYIEITDVTINWLKQQVNQNTSDIVNNKVDISNTIAATTANTNNISNKIDIGWAADDINTHSTLVDKNKITP